MLEIPGPPGESPRIFLPGWGFDGRVLALGPASGSWLAPAGLYDPFTLAEELALWLEQRGSGQCELWGWSLGGLCALDFARRFPERVASLRLLGVRAAWPAAELAAIRRELREQAEDFLRSFYRKCFLGYRAEYLAFQHRLEAAYLNQAQAAPELLRRGLDFLALTPAPVSSTLAIQGLHGRRDLIAPVGQRLRLPGVAERVLEQGGHALFLEESLYKADAPPPARPAKDLIRQRFNRAAATYDDHADIQRQALELLAAELPPSLPPGPLLELGCGTGNYTRLLRQRFPEARLVSLDFSPAMLGEARRKIETLAPPGPKVGAPVDFICQDAETFLAANRTRFACITANATIQWFSDPAGAFARIRASLLPGGLLLATIFGRESLAELDQGLARVSRGQVRVAARLFPDREELQRLLTAQFGEVELREHRLTRRFSSLPELLRHFRHTGTGGAGLARLSPGRYRELAAWFAHRPRGCEVSFQVLLAKGRAKGGQDEAG
ncbi:alpha/beta fold hydrolase [Desulfurivibrio sp. D14AmB]|uniref:alpha/beta fold hydrolase n=1 Tax=Desulfurivibrio sp. D14AmB TaxID=3374370 RepID=UPI00376EEFE8